jgi:hypothetical protein
VGGTRSPFTESEKADLLATKANLDSIGKLTPEELKYLEEMRAEESAHAGKERPPYSRAERDELLALRARINNAGGNQKYFDQLIDNNDKANDKSTVATAPPQEQENK